MQDVVYSINKISKQYISLIMLNLDIITKSTLIDDTLQEMLIIEAA